MLDKYCAMCWRCLSWSWSCLWCMKGCTCSRLFEYLQLLFQGVMLWKRQDMLCLTAWGSAPEKIWILCPGKILTRTAGSICNPLLVCLYFRALSETVPWDARSKGLTGGAQISSSFAVMPVVAQEWKTGTVAPAKVQIGQYPLPWWQPEWILREEVVLRFTSCMGVVLLQFPWYFADTLYNLLWVAQHATTQLWVPWKKHFLLLVNIFYLLSHGLLLWRVVFCS